MNAFIIELENRPGTLASVTAALAEKGINISGGAAVTVGNQGALAIVTNDEAGARSALDGAGVTYREIGLISASVEDRAGALADVSRRLADAGINIEAMFPTGMSGTTATLTLGVDDVEGAKRALGDLATVGAE